MMIRNTLTADEFEDHVRGLFGGAKFFTTAEAARIEGVQPSTVDNASYRGQIVGVGSGKLKRYALWEIYKWHELRRKPRFLREPFRRIKRSKNGH